MPPGRELEAIAFYEGVLGISRIAKPVHLAARGGVWFEGNDFQVHLGVDEVFSPSRKAHPALLVDDLARLRGRLEGAGIEIGGEPFPAYKRFYVNDPFGNRLELLQADSA